MIKKSLFSFICIFFVLVSCKPLSNNSSTGNSDDFSTNNTEQDDDTSSFATFDAVDAIEIVESPVTGVALGWGWNRGDSEPIPTICVEFVPGEEPAQTRYMTMSEIHDSYDLMKSVGMSAEASVKTIGFEVEGKASFAKSQKLTSNKSHFVMNAIVQNGVRYASPIPIDDSRVNKYQNATNERGGSSGSIRLTEEAVKKAKNIDQFRRHCGSSFVSAIYGGAKLTALISMESSTKEEKEILSAEMSGSGWGVKVKAKVDAAAEKKAGHEQMDVSIFMTGGKGDAIPVDVKDLKAKMETISMDAYVAPKDFQIAITPYELLSNWPGKPLPDKETEFEELASYWGAYNTLYDDLQRVLDNPEDYFDLDVDEKGQLALRYCLKESDSYMQALDQMQTELARINKQNQDLKSPLNFVGFGAFSPNFVELVSIVHDSGSFKEIQDELEVIEKSKEALEQCAEEQNDLKDVSIVNIEKLKRAQDEVLSSLKRLEDEARECSDKTDKCEFNVNKYRSPYAYRAQLPVPTSSDVINFKDLVDYKMGLIAKRRCQVSANDTDCLSNQELDNWAQKIGLISVNTHYQSELFDKFFPSVSTEEIKEVPVDVAVMELGREDVLWINPASLAK